MSSNCDFCNNATDTKRHRLLECPLFQEIRNEHQAIVDELNDSDDVLTELPVMDELNDSEHHSNLQNLKRAYTVILFVLCKETM